MGTAVPGSGANRVPSQAPDAPGIPATRAARHALITELLARESLGSQAELAQALAARGVQVTQGTLSRDLDALGAVKVRAGDGSPVYRVARRDRDASQLADGEGRDDERLRRWCADLLLTGEAIAHTLVLRTPPGAAQMLASALDGGGLPGMLGSVAGDDTIIVISRDAATAEKLLDHLLHLAEKRKA